MNYDLLNLIVAILSLALAAYTSFKTNSGTSIQNRISNIKVTNVYVTKETTKHSYKNNDNDAFFIGLIIILLFTFLTYLYFTYITIAYLLLNIVNLVCIFCLYILSKKISDTKYVQYINIELVSLALISIYLNVSRLNALTPDSFNILQFTSEKMNWSSLSEIIKSGLTISTDSIKYLYGKASFETQTFFISRALLLLFSMTYILSNFIAIFKIKSNRFNPSKIKSQIKFTILFNFICLFLLLNLLKTVIPYLKNVL